MRQIGKTYSLRTKKEEADRSVDILREIKLRIGDLVEALRKEGYGVRDCAIFGSGDGHNYLIEDSKTGKRLGEIHPELVSTYGNTQLEEFLSKYRFK